MECARYGSDPNPLCRRDNWFPIDNTTIATLIVHGSIAIVLRQLKLHCQSVRYMYIYTYIYIYTFMYRGEALCVPSHCVGTCACWEMKSLRSMSVVRSSMSYRQNLSMPLAAMLCNECGLTEVHRSFALKTLLRWNDISQRMPHAAIPDWCKYERNAPSVCPFQTFRKIAMDVNSWTMQL